MPAHDPRSRRAVAFALGAVVAIALAATVAGAQETEPADRGEPLVARGLELFSAHCATCHGALGRGIEGVAPGISDAPPALVDFVIRTGRMPLPEPDARSVRRTPRLTEEQREAVVAYFEAEIGPDRPDVPEVRPEEGDLARGQFIYEGNCVACHSAFGNGVAVSQEDIAPPLHAASPVEVAEAVRTGPGVMPPFGAEQIGETDMDSLVRYVLFLRDRPTPGGVVVGRSGPVTEGLVALVGTLVLLVGLYFIGERRRD